MQVPLNEFNPEQRLWYAHLIIAAIKSDESVAPQEMSHLIMAMHFLTREEKEEAQITLRMKTTIPGLNKIPGGIDKAMLAAIYSDIVRVVISDGKLTVKEQAFLAQMRDLFHFEIVIDAGLQEWTREMLELEQRRRKLIAEVK